MVYCFVSGWGAPAKADKLSWIYCHAGNTAIAIYRIFLLKFPLWQRPFRRAPYIRSEMKKVKKNRLIIILGSLTALGPLSIDMYLPAFSAIAEDLETSIASVGLSLTSYFIGISIGQLIYGPLLDRFGRKPPLQIGLIIFLLAALGCALSTSVESLIGMRFILALGGCVGMVAGRAIVRDLFPPNETAGIFSTLILVMGIAPVVAPTLGGFITANFGWQAIFYLLVASGAIMSIVIWQFLDESKGADPTVSLGVKSVFREYFEVIRHRVFLTYAIAAGSASGGLFAYVAGSPTLYMELLGLTETQYGWVFGLNAFGLIAGSQLNRLWLKKQPGARIAFNAGGFQTGAATLLILITLLSGIQHLGAIIALIFIYLFWLGFLFPNTTALALEPFSRHAGRASALIGGIQMASGALSSAFVSSFYNGTPYPMTTAMTVAALMCFGMLTLRHLLIKMKRRERVQ